MINFATAAYNTQKLVELLKQINAPAAAREAVQAISKMRATGPAPSVFVGVFAAGVAAGAAGALLLAPASGADLRRKLRGRIQGTIARFNRESGETDDAARPEAHAAAAPMDDGTLRPVN